MKISIILIFCSFLVNTCSAQKIIPDSLYWGQTPPGDSAIVFASGIISFSNRRETKLVFSPGGQECLIGIGLNDTLRLLYSNHYSGYWINPIRPNFITNYRAQEPFFSPDSLHIFFTSLGDIYMSTRVNQIWTNPQRLSSPVNSGSTEYHPTTTLDGTLYFCSMRENGSGYIYRSRYDNGNYSTIEKLNKVINCTTQQDGAYDPFIAPDESYLVFTCIRPDGYGREDQYISYNRNGNWTNPKNIGPKINTNKIEYGSYISPDGKYYFFSRPIGWNANDSADIFWVSANFIERLKHTNFVPYLKNQIPNQTDTVGVLYNYTIPDSIFFDDDGNNTLTDSATLSNGNALPTWLSFNPVTRTFSGTPTEIGLLSIKVTATDTANAKATCTFTLNIVEHTSIHPINENVINKYKLFQNYPNPFNPSTVIGYSILNNSYVNIKLYNILGKEITTLVDSFQKRGMYDVSLNMNNLNLASGFYFYTLNVNEQSSGKIFKETRIMNYIK
jgi:hypothetical protein